MAYLQVDGLILFCTGMVVLIALFFQIKRRKLPPGPVGFPILGCYPSLRKGHVKALNDMAKKYGNVFGFYIGPQYLVVLNDWDSMTEAFSQSPCLYRPPALFSNIPYNFGIAGINGPEWYQARRLTSKTMKDIGLHRTRWEELLQEEVAEVLSDLLKRGEGPLNVRDFFSDTFANNIMTFVLGERLPVGHPFTKVVNKSVDTIMNNSPTLEMVNFSPLLRNLLHIVGVEKKFQLPVLMQDFSNSVSDKVDEKVQTPGRETEDSFIDQFHSEIQKDQKYKQDDSYAENTLKGNVVALLVGGSETTRTSFIWTLIAMADYPETQKMVHEELDRVIGKDGSIKWADRSKVPYTFAVLLEAMRWRTVVPISAMRMAAENMTVQGYHIPKGSFVTANSWAIHNDPRYWKEPEKFIPERFLEDDGKRVNTSPKSFFPFSYGKRNCPGQLIAMMENLQYFTSLMQKFKVVSKDGKKVEYDAVLGLTYQAYNIELCFIARQ